MSLEDLAEVRTSIRDLTRNHANSYTVSRSSLNQWERHINNHRRQCESNQREVSIREAADQLRIRSLEEENNTLKQANAHLNTLQNNLNTTQEELKRKRETLTESEAKRLKTEERVTSLLADNRNLDEIIKALRASHDEQIAKVTSINEQFTQLEDRFSRLLLEKETLDTKLEEVREAKKTLGAELTAKYNQLAEQYNSLLQQAKETESTHTERLQALQQELSLHLASFNEAQTTIATLQERERNHLREAQIKLQQFQEGLALIVPDHSIDTSIQSLADEQDRYWKIISTTLSVVKIGQNTRTQLEKARDIAQQQAASLQLQIKGFVQLFDHSLKDSRLREANGKLVVPNLPAKINAVIRELDDCLKHRAAMSEQASASSATNTTSLTLTQLQALYQNLPEAFRSGRDQPATSQAYADAIAEYLRNPSGTPPPADCNHRRELATVLLSEISLSWEDAINRVRELKQTHNPPVGEIIPERSEQPCNHQEALASVLGLLAATPWDVLLGQVRLLMRTMLTGAVAPPAPTTTSSPKLPFAIKDVPELADIRKHMDYQRTMRRFVLAHEVSVPNILVTSAMNAIATGWTDPILNRMSSSVNVNDFAPAGTNFVTAWNNMSRWLHSNLTSSQQFVAETASWADMKREARKAKSAQEFYTLFKACLYRFNEASDRVGQPHPTPTEITRHFVEALPKEIATLARGHGLRIDTQPFETYQDRLDDLWPLVREAPPKVLSTKREREESEDLYDEEIYAYPAQKRRRTGGCPSRDTAPVDLRGSITAFEGQTKREREDARARWERCRSRNVCRSCRHPRSAHSPKDTFQEIPDWKGPSVRFTGIQEEENIPEQSEGAVKDEGESDSPEIPMPKCLTNRVSIADPRLKAGYVYSKDRKGARIDALADTGAQVDLISDSLVELLALPCDKLPKPVKIGSVNDNNAMTLTQSTTIKHRIGQKQYIWTFLVAPMPGKPDVILGLPWMEKFCPEILKILDQLGLTKSTRTIQDTKNDEAFRQGGVLAAILSEEDYRKELTDECLENQETTLFAYTMRAAVLDCLESKVIEQEVRGLTGNKPGWELTIPEKFRKYNQTLFSDPPIGEIPKRPGFECEIKLKDGAKRKSCKLYAMSQEELQVLKQLLDHELALGFIRPSKAEHSAPVFFVRDPPSEGRNQGQLRMVVDYRDLNQNIKQDDYVPPLSTQILRWIANFKFARKFDMRGGFRGIPMAEGSAELAAFKTPLGQYEPTVMPMGLSTAPAIYQRFMNYVLQDLIGVCCFAYLDDVIVVGNSQEELDQATEAVLSRLAQHQVRIKPSKCVWDADEVSFLGYTWVRGKGLRMARDKMKFLHEIKEPRGLRDVRSMLGMANFYRNFIPHYADKIVPLTNLTRKGEDWRWELAEKEAWKAVLKSIREDVFLQGHIPEREVVMGTDASDVALGGYIAQPDDNGHLRPLLFFHHKFDQSQVHWSAGDKELYAIVYAYENYPEILLSAPPPVQIYSDHQRLSRFMFTDLRSHRGRHARWVEILQEANFIINYLPGEQNVVADFITRYGQDDAAALQEHVLLPLHRFSDKAQDDLLSWFKKTPNEMNIHERLERSFASRHKMQDFNDCQTDEAAAEKRFLAKLNDSPDPVPDPAARMGLTQRQHAEAEYRRLHPEARIVDPRDTRKGNDKRGLGFNPGPLLSDEMEWS
ncbi:hypothetical protein DL771_011284 [Monosporascus sp. 5C6A]|nr:hypothetical protein DL771_011284 [Monosporascus sp. 5C6A]